MRPCEIYAMMFLIIGYGFRSLAAQRLRNRLRSSLSGIPRLKDGVGILLGPVHSQRRTIEQHHHQRLAGSFGGFQKLLLRGKRSERERQRGPCLSPNGAHQRFMQPVADSPGPHPIAIDISKKLKALKHEGDSRFLDATGYTAGHHGAAKYTLN